MSSDMDVIKRILSDSRLMQVEALKAGDMKSFDLASDKVRAAEAVLQRHKNDGLKRPTYLIAGLVLLVGGALALVRVPKPAVNLSSSSTAVALEIGEERIEMLPGTTSVSELQTPGSRALSACAEGCPYKRIEVDAMRAGAGTTMQLRSEDECLILLVKSGFVSLVGVRMFDGKKLETCEECLSDLSSGHTVKMCGLETTLLVPVTRALVADESRPIQDAPASPSLVSGSLSFTDLGGNRDLAPGTLIGIADMEGGYAAVDVGRTLSMRLNGRSGVVRIGDKQRDARPSVLEAITRSPGVLEWVSLVTGLLVFSLGLRSNLRRLGAVVEGDL